MLQAISNTCGEISTMGSLLFDVQLQVYDYPFHIPEIYGPLMVALYS